MSVFSHPGMSEAERVPLDYPDALTFKQHEALEAIHPLTAAEATALAKLSLVDQVAVMELAHAGQAWHGDADAGIAKDFAFKQPHIGIEQV